jgi:pimeloyl-ACP methyl ester carboxylesterase
MATALQALHEAGVAPPSALPQDAEAAEPPASPSAGSAQGPYDGAEGVIAVMCGDSPAVALDRFPTLASEVMLRSGYFGLSTSFTLFPCSSWTVLAADPYVGPWDKQTGARPLVVNTTHDPSTPMPNAEAMARLMPGAVLLRVDGFGHTSLLNRSTCANERIAAYLVDLTLPPPNARCAQDRQPFEE